MTRRSLLPSLLLALLCALLFAPIASAQSLPRLNGQVSDLADKLSSSDETAVSDAINSVVSNSGGKIHQIYVLLNPDLSGYKSDTAAGWGAAVFTFNELKTNDVLIAAGFGPNGLAVTSGSDLKPIFDRSAPGGAPNWRRYAYDQMKGDFGGKRYLNALLTGINVVALATDVTVPAQSGAARPAQGQAQAPAPAQSAPVAQAPVRSGPGGLFWCFLLGIIAIVALLIFLWWRRQNGYNDLGGVTTTGGYRRGGYTGYDPGGYSSGPIIIDRTEHHHHHDSPSPRPSRVDDDPGSDGGGFGSSGSRSSGTSFGSSSSSSSSDSDGGGFGSSSSSSSSDSAPSSDGGGF